MPSPSLVVFELPQIAKALKLDLAKAKNWTNGRTGLLIEPSIRKSTGTGSSNLYSREDLYLFAIAQEFSKAGFAAKAIGKLVESSKPFLDKPVERGATWTLWRITPAGPFHIDVGKSRPPNRTLWFTLKIGALIRSAEERAAQSKVTLPLTLLWRRFDR